MANRPAVETLSSARTLLFVPGHRPDRFAKAAASGADVVLIDLEDAVGPGDKDAARVHADEWLASGQPAVIRINGSETDWYQDDVQLVAKYGVPVMLPKAESAERVAAVVGLHPRAVVLPLLETANGVGRASEIAAADGVARLAFGSIDYAAQLGIDPNDREALLLARSTIVLASARAGLAGPIDGVTTALSDPQMTMEDATYARRLGLTAKLCIHPAQVAAVCAAFAPSADDIAWARKVLAAADAEQGAVAVDGKMVDLPVLTLARGVIAAAGQC